MKIPSKLTRPRQPRAAFLLDAEEVAAVELRQKGRGFSLAAAARTPLAPGLLAPSFDNQNIGDVDQLAAIVDATASAAGLNKRDSWSVLMPEDAIKSLVVTLDSVPSSRQELREMVNWKVERIVGVPISELRLARHFVSTGREPRFLVAAAKISVLQEYEALFTILGWRVGLLVPRYVGEAAWFDWDASVGDKLVVGARGATCQAAFVRDGELLFVRQIYGDPSRIEDESYRLALFYRDRIAEQPETASVASVLTCGGVDVERVAAAVAEALGTAPAIVEPIPAMLEPEAGVEIDAGLLAAAGLATQAWSR
jgi:Tfp pilus assembly PilM family ATPase